MRTKLGSHSNRRLCPCTCTCSLTRISFSCSRAYICVELCLEVFPLAVLITSILWFRLHMALVYAEHASYP